jgi:hypothetical protein
MGGVGKGRSRLSFIVVACWVKAHCARRMCQDLCFCAPGGGSLFYVACGAGGIGAEVVLVVLRKVTEPPHCIRVDCKLHHLDHQVSSSSIGFQPFLYHSIVSSAIQIFLYIASKAPFHVFRWISRRRVPSGLKFLGLSPTSLNAFHVTRFDAISRASSSPRSSELFLNQHPLVIIHPLTCRASLFNLVINLQHSTITISSAIVRIGSSRVILSSAPVREAY